MGYHDSFELLKEKMGRGSFRIENFQLIETRDGGNDYAPLQSRYRVFSATVNDLDLQVTCRDIIYRRAGKQTTCSLTKLNL